VDAVRNGRGGSRRQNQGACARGVTQGVATDRSQVDGTPVYLETGKGSGRSTSVDDVTDVVILN